MNGVYQDFISIQFELPREQLEGLLRSQAQAAADPQRYMQTWGAELPTEAEDFKKQMQEGMRTTYENLPPDKKKDIREIGKVLPHLEDQLFAQAQLRYFCNALERAEELLSTGRIMLRNDK